MLVPKVFYFHHIVLCQCLKVTKWSKEITKTNEQRPLEWASVFFGPNNVKGQVIVEKEKTSDEVSDNISVSSLVFIVPN
jgi:hypothetical protein